MGAGASAVDVGKQFTEASEADIQACVNGLDADARAKLSAAMAGCGGAGGGGKAPVDTSSLTFKCATDAKLREAGLLDPAPAAPTYNVAVMGTYVDEQENGGKDKVIGGALGLRFDTPGICNGLIKQNINAQLLPYHPSEHDAFMEVLKKFDAGIIRINPGQITAQGGDQQKFDKDIMEITKSLPVWPTPETMEKMGAKDALCNVKDMEFGLPDTLGYYSPEDMKTTFPKSVAFQPRVVKQNRGSAGEGIWIIKLKDETKYCEKYGDRSCDLGEMLILKEANDFHEEEHTVGEFIEFCTNGRSEASGTWTSIGSGKYYEGGVEAGGQMVDQRFLPRIEEGEARFVMIGTKLNRVEHYEYIGGVSGETKTTIYSPAAADFPANYKELQDKMENQMGDYLKALNLPETALPLLWAADFIPVDGHIMHHVIGEFNCSCLGIAGFLNSRGKDLKDMTPDDAAMGQKMAELIGQICKDALEKK